MADNKLLQQMLEHLVNEDQQKAEELFHEYVVAASREIYESLIDSEISEEAEDDEDEDEDDEEMDEAAKSEKEEDEEDLDEEFEDVAIEAGDDMMGGDATDDLEGDLEMDGEDEPAEKGEEDLFQDLEAIVDELQAKFDELKGIESDEHGGEFGDDDSEDEMKDSLEPELSTVREYVEKVAPAKMGDDGVNTKSVVDNMKNDMGGTTANIVKGGEAKGEGTKGGLLNPATKEDNAGNINVPGGKAGKTGFTHKEAGHGAEKKGAAESADNKQSLFRARR